MVTMGNLDPPQPLRSVKEVRGTSGLPDEIVGYLSARLRVTREGGRPLSSERRAGRGVHAFLGHLASGADPVPGLECLTLLGVRPGRNCAPPEIVFLRPRRPIF